MRRIFAGGTRQDEDSPLYRCPHWYACHTRARHEKRVEEQLALRGVETYLPLFEEVRQWSDRRKTVEFPLFPGYVFARFVLGSLHEVVQIPGVATVIRHNGSPSPIPDGEVENVRRFVAALRESGQTPAPRPLEPGEPVRVMHGPFKGVTGFVVERRGRRRVLVGLTAIGQGIEIDIDGRNLQPIRLSESFASH
jgi:transcription termination/antitermination protein NusG